MRYKIDHDYHIHSHLSYCSDDPEQNNERILQYAKDNGLNRICLTNHYWDSAVPGASSWYQSQNFEHLYRANPLPQAENVQFLFGCETDMDKKMMVGIPQKRFQDFSFIIISTTHLHMTGFTIAEEDAASNLRRAKLWGERLEHVLNLSLPFYKIGISHLASNMINRQSRKDYLTTLNSIPDEEMERLFAKAASVGYGIELNQEDMSFADSETEIVLRPFRIAKNAGCKFYLGSDAHHPAAFEKTDSIFSRAISLLALEEKDKFILK